MSPTICNFGLLFHPAYPQPMGIIETIQKRSGLVSAFLGVFIFAILLSNGFVSLEYFFSEKKRTHILAIDDHEIKEHEYKRKFAMYMQRITEQYGNHPSGKEHAHIQTYDSYLLQYALQPKAASVGLFVPREEVNESLTLVIEKYAEYMATNKETLAVDQKMRGEWIMYLNQQKERLNAMAQEESLNKVKEKMTALLDLSTIIANPHLGMTYAEVPPAADKKSRQAGPAFRLTYINVSIMPDKEEITDEEQQAYYAKYSKKYPELTTKPIELIVLPIGSNSKDKDTTKQDIAGLRVGFEKTTNPKAFAAHYTEAKEAIVIYTKETLPPLLKKMLQQSKKNQVIGPFITEDQSYALYRLLPKQKGAKPGELHLAVLSKKITPSQESEAAVMQRAKDYCTRIKNKASWQKLIEEEKLQHFTIQVTDVGLRNSLGKRTDGVAIYRKAAAGTAEKTLSAPFQQGDQVFIAYVLPQEKKDSKDENFQKNKDNILLEIKKARICQKIANLGPKVTYNALLKGIEGLDPSAHIRRYKQVRLSRLLIDKNYPFATQELKGAAYELKPGEQAPPIITPHGIVIIERLASKHEQHLRPAISLTDHKKEEEKRQKDKTATNLHRLLNDNAAISIDDKRYIFE